MASLSEYADAHAVPALVPVVINLPRPRLRAVNPTPVTALQTCVVWPDIQAHFMRNFRTGALTPTHDRRALDVALQITAAVKPDRVVLLGDNLDLPDWSLKFLRSPEMYWGTQPAAVELAWWLAQIRLVCPNAKIDYIEGNHEARMATAIEANAVAAYGMRPVDDLNGPGLLTVPRLLSLASLGIEYHGAYPHGEVWLNDTLRLHHGELVAAKSGGTVRKMVDSSAHSEGQGHVHRLELATRTSWGRDGGTFSTAFSPGTLCDIRPGVVPGASGRPNWQQGVAVIEYELGEQGEHHIDLVQIREGRALYGRKVYLSREVAAIVEEAEAATNYTLS